MINWQGVVSKLMVISKEQNNPLLASQACTLQSQYSRAMKTGSYVVDVVCMPLLSQILAANQITEPQRMSIEVEGVRFWDEWYSTDPKTVAALRADQYRAYGPPLATKLRASIPALVKNKMGVPPPNFIPPDMVKQFAEWGYKSHRELFVQLWDEYRAKVPNTGFVSFAETLAGATGIPWRPIQFSVWAVRETFNNEEITKVPDGFMATGSKEIERPLPTAESVVWGAWDTLNATDGIYAPNPILLFYPEAFFVLPKGQLENFTDGEEGRKYNTKWYNTDQFSNYMDWRPIADRWPAFFILTGKGSDFERRWEFIKMGFGALITFFSGNFEKAFAQGIFGTFAKEMDNMNANIAAMQESYNKATEEVEEKKLEVATLSRHAWAKTLYHRR